MEARTRWFDRKFDLGLPAEAFSDILERLRSAPGRLEHLVAGLAPEQLTQRMDDAWSIQENLGHLIDLEPLWDGRLDDFLADRGELRPADLENRKTHEAEHNERELADLLAEFRSIRFSMVARLESQPSDFLSREARHPRLGQPMRPTDLIFFVAEHDDQHLITITELIRHMSP